MEDAPGVKGEFDYDLTDLRVMHMRHPLQSDPSDISTTVRMGFKWAEVGEGQGIFLCVCTDPCLDSENCGRTFFGEDSPEGGKQIIVTMPWTDGSGELVTFLIWCCASCEVQGTGSIFDVWVGRFFDIPARLLQYEHETRARSYGGLRKSMGKAYPDTFTEGSFVTLVMYRRTS